MTYKNKAIYCGNHMHNGVKMKKITSAESTTNSLKVYTVHDVMYWAQCKWVMYTTSNPHSPVFYRMPIGTLYSDHPLFK